MPRGDATLSQALPRANSELAGKRWPSMLDCLRMTSRRTSVGGPIPRRVKLMTERIVRRFAPERVILFGSHARDMAGPDSDIDLLVIMPVKGSRRQKAVEIAVALHDFDEAKDIVVSTPEDFAWRKDVVGTIEYPAAREGRVVYAKR